MTRLELPTSDHTIAADNTPIGNAIFYLSGSQPNTLLDLSKFIRELDQLPEIKHYAAYIIFKQANSLLAGATGPLLDSLVIEIQSKFHNLGIESSYLGYDNTDTSEGTKRTIVQRGILTIFLFRAALDSLYIPTTTGVSGPILSVIYSLMPENPT